MSHFGSCLNTHSEIGTRSSRMFAVPTPPSWGVSSKFLRVHDPNCHHEHPKIANDSFLSFWSLQGSSTCVDLRIRNVEPSGLFRHIAQSRYRLWRSNVRRGLWLLFACRVNSWRDGERRGSLLRKVQPCFLRSFRTTIRTMRGKVGGALISLASVAQGEGSCPNRWDCYCVQLFAKALSAFGIHRGSNEGN